MVFDLIPIVLVLGSLFAIIFIVIRKFPQTANINLDELPEEKQASLKDEILEKQLEKKLGGLTAKIKIVFEPIKKIFGSRLVKIKNIFVTKKQKLEDKKEEIRLSEKTDDEILHELLDEGASLMEENRYSEAEEKFIRALEIDKSVDIVYENLAEIYVAQKKYDYAIETLKYLIVLENKKISQAESENDKDGVKLLQRELAQVHFELANVYKKIDEIKEAKKSTERALLIDFRNPRYLDFLCEVCIILGDKLGAQTCISRLREVNADNNKIERWEGEIEKLS